MKLYSIWWEEEILLMCSCNDCSKRGGEWKGETDGCLHLNSLKGIKALKADFSAFCSSPPLRNGFSSSELTLLQTQSLPLTLQAWNCCDASRPGVSRPFDSWMENVLLTRPVECEAGRRQKPVCLIHLQLIRHGNRASTDRVVFPERNNGELL